MMDYFSLLPREIRDNVVHGLTNEERSILKMTGRRWSNIRPRCTEREIISAMENKFTREELSDSIKERSQPVFVLKVTVLPNIDDKERSEASLMVFYPDRYSRHNLR